MPQFFSLGAGRQDGRLTIHSSRRRSATRLNSGVRPVSFLRLLRLVREALSFPGFGKFCGVVLAARAAGIRWVRLAVAGSIALANRRQGGTPVGIILPAGAGPTSWLRLT